MNSGPKGQILKSDNVMMNYLNYNKSIIQKHHVKLVGWPKNIKFITPANLSSVDEVRALIHALKSEECRWVSLSTADVEEHMASIVACEAAGEQIGRKRKQRSDKGMPRKKSAERVLRCTIFSYCIWLQGHRSPSLRMHAMS